MEVLLLKNVMRSKNAVHVCVFLYCLHLERAIAIFIHLKILIMLLHVYTVNDVIRGQIIFLPHFPAQPIFDIILTVQIWMMENFRPLENIRMKKESLKQFF